MSKLIVLVIEFFLISVIPGRKYHVRNVLFLIFSVIFSFQASSFIFTNDFIPPLAFSNLSEFHSIGKKPLFYFIGVLLSLFVISYLMMRIKHKDIISKAGLLIYILLIIILSKNTIHSFYKSLKMYREEIELVKGFDRKNVFNSLLKDEIVYDSRAENFLQKKKYNVIVIFTEGMSRGVISNEVTPNIYKFAQSSIDVRNYYNHTAATFRGLRGQLTSCFQMTGGCTDISRGVIEGISEMSNEKVKIKYGRDNTTISLANILSANNYTTSFQASNSIDAQLSVMVSTLGFDNIYGLESKKDHQKWAINELSDKDSYELLYDNLIKQKEPFFYAIYTVGTHIGLDSPDIKFKNGQNEYLNKFHNMDVHFGKFIKQFNDSPLSENTLLIFTADHATYPEPKFMETFKTKSYYFVDEIPLLIYKKGILPKKINAHRLNSLSLAPTILDILGIHKAHNMFIGLSIFDKAKHPIENKVSAIGTLYFTTDNGQVSLTKNKVITSSILKYQLFGG